MSEGNEWAKSSSLLGVVFSHVELDCVIGERRYCLFDTGMATAFMILRATELDLVAHPIAGYNPAGVKNILKVPEKYRVITLIIFGKHASGSNSLSEKQKASEKERLPRLDWEDFLSFNQYGLTEF